MKINSRAKDNRVDTKTKLAGGYGTYAAKQDEESLLRRSVMACLLWEDNAYESGISVNEQIKDLIPKIDPQTVYDIAIEARTKQKLRHVPLFIAREMARLPEHKRLVGSLLPNIIKRADELTEFMALYWKDEKCPISKQVKLGLSRAFQNFDEYQFAKYNRDEQIKIRDVLFLVHPNPGQKSELFKKIAENELVTPDTWEVALSSGADKNETWTRLISEKKLGALAFMRNLRNMEQSGVLHETIKSGFETINPNWLLPLNYFAAAQNAPDWTREIESLMLRGYASMPKLPGHTIFVVDVSGSMNNRISGKSKFNRLDAAAAMAVLAAENCEHVSIYVTAGSDSLRVHKTEKIKPYRGFALSDHIKSRADYLGGGGIFTRQCLEYIKKCEKETPNRIIIFSDSQDCDAPDKRIPSPFGLSNYIVDVSANSRGINYDGVWTAEITGWSEHFLEYIFAFEGLTLYEAE